MGIQEDMSPEVHISNMKHELRGILFEIEGLQAKATDLEMAIKIKEVESTEISENNS